MKLSQPSLADATFATNLHFQGSQDGRDLA